MSKKKRPTQKTRLQIYQDEQSQVYRTTSRGVTVKCLPVAHLLEKVRTEVTDEYPDPVPPMRKLEGVGEVEIPYTEDTIAVEGVPEEDKAAWADYQQKMREIEMVRGERTLKVIALRGVEFEMRPGWEEEHEFMGLRVPEGDAAKLYHYFTTEVVGNKMDGFLISQGISEASGVDKELLATAEDTFLDTLGESEWDESGTDSDDLGEEGEGEE